VLNQNENASVAAILLINKDLLLLLKVGKIETINNGFAS